MNDDEVSPHLRELIDAERAEAADVDRAGIRARIGATLGLAPIAMSTKTAAAGASTSTTVAAAGASGKILGIVVAVGIAGGGVTALVRNSSSSPAKPVPARLDRAPRAPENRSRTTPITEAVMAPAPPVSSQPQMPPSAKPAPHRVSVDPPRDVAPSETSLLGDASRALANRDPHRVLALVAEHARLYRDGALAEERDALEIEALLALGRREEAAEAASKFSMRYPHSIHQPLIERAQTAKEIR
jgi:hypothetical protein